MKLPGTSMDCSNVRHIYLIVGTCSVLLEYKFGTHLLKHDKHKTPYILAVLFHGFVVLVWANI